MTKLAALEKRLDQLTEAHRVFAARNEALFQSSKIMYALIDTPLPMLQHLVHRVHDATAEHMDRLNWDTEFQIMVKAALDELQAVALAARKQ